MLPSSRRCLSLSLSLGCFITLLYSVMSMHMDTASCSLRGHPSSNSCFSVAFLFSRVKTCHPFCFFAILILPLTVAAVTVPLTTAVLGGRLSLPPHPQPPPGVPLTHRYTQAIKQTVDAVQSRVGALTTAGGGAGLPECPLSLELDPEKTPWSTVFPLFGRLRRDASVEHMAGVRLSIFSLVCLASMV